jgi:N-acetylneuraminic acid mutarotase
MPNTGTRMVGVFFPANGKFYAMGGRMSDSAGSEFTHPLEYDPVANAWTTKSATYPDTHVNNMACGVLTDAGTPYIYCMGGSQVTVTGTFDRVFRYDPVPDVISPVAAPWPGGLGMVLPGGFTVFNNKLYILGGFDTVTNGGQGTNQIWEFTPSPAAWVQKPTVLPVPLGYIPTTTIGSLIYTGGGSDITAGVLTDTTNSFVYNPVANTISTIATIPRATAETRALNFCNNMYVMGGGRTAPNPSNEVDVYDPVANTWSLGQPFVNARRNFPTATDGTNHIWLSGGYGSDGVTVLDSMEIFTCPVSPCGLPSPTPTATVTASATPTATATATATTTASATATATATATAAPRSTPTPRPRPTPPPRP